MFLKLPENTEHAKQILLRTLKTVKLSQKQILFTSF